MYKPLIIDNKRVNVLTHECSTKKEIPLCCIDAQGIVSFSANFVAILLCNTGTQHSILFSCCNCEPTAVTMVKARLWPASPSFPKLAFTFELLEWAEALMLECQVALGDFCKALQFLSPHGTNKVS